MCAREGRRSAPANGPRGGPRPLRRRVAGGVGRVRATAGVRARVTRTVAVVPAHPTAPAGRHVLAELAGADPALLDDAATLCAALRTALTDAGATVLQMVAESFRPQGVTVVALLAESHASVHTWPEHGTAHVDVFTCGESADPERAARAFAAAVGAATTRVQVLDRGGPAGASPSRSRPG